MKEEKRRTPGLGGLLPWPNRRPGVRGRLLEVGLGAFASLGGEGLCPYVLEHHRETDNAKGPHVASGPAVKIAA
jgi:hypothetical protein